MMIARAWLAVLVLELIGAATLTLLCSEVKRWGLPAKLGLSFGLGLVVLTVTLFLASLCGLAPRWWFGVVEMLCLAAAAALVRRTQLRAWLPRAAATLPPPSPPWARAMEIGATSLILSLCVLVGAVSLLEPLVEWDVIAIWAYKAKILWYGPVSASSYFHDASKAYSHLDYPLLWPLAMTSLWSWVGTADLQAVKLLAPALLCAMAAAFYGLLRRSTDRPRSLLFVALVLGLPMVLSQTARLMADAPLSFFVATSFMCCYLWLKTGQRDDLRLAGFFTAGMLFTKNEGMGFFLILLAGLGIGLISQGRRDQLRPVAVWLLLVPLALTAPWFAFRLGIPKLHEDYGSRISPVYFLENISRAPEILGGSIRYWGNTEDWLIFWPLLVIVLALSVRAWTRWPLVFLFAAVTLALLMYGYVFVVTPWNLDELMENTANRLLLHIAPLSALLLAESVESARLLRILDPRAAGQGLRDRS